MHFLLFLLALMVFPTMAKAQRFFPDDPLWSEPRPVSVGKVEPQRLDNLIDFYKNTFHDKGERQATGKVIPSLGANTLGEVPDSAWYTNRQKQRRMSLAEMAMGPNRAGPPAAEGKWTVTSAKGEGVTPGFSIKDGAGRRYLLKFDPASNTELATGADAVSAKFFYALGYNVPENYPVRFRREQLVIGEKVAFTDRYGRRRNLKEEDVDDMLKAVRPYADGSYRAMASYFLAGELVGPFKYYKRRADDPNESTPHEHLRVLRGLYVFAAWLNHTDAKSLNSLDVVVTEEGRRFVKHYLIDFGASLGSDSLYAKDPRLGHEYFLAARPGVAQLATLGLMVPKYARVKYPKDPAVGNFESEAFDPDRWRSNYPNAAFENRLPGDEFWAAKQVMAFTDDEIRAMVKTGNYSNLETERVLAEILIRRRDLIGKTFFGKVLPLDGFAVENHRLVFRDLAEQFRLGGAVPYEVAWSRFSNTGPGTIEASVVARGVELPASADGAYWAARIQTPGQKLGVTVFVRKDVGGWRVVGVERDGENAWRAH
jgi:hypothetical protein